MIRISDNQESHLIDPIWTSGRVPNGFWDRRANRMLYMKWLGGKLRFQKPEDWYRISKQHFKENYGGGVLNTIYQDSPQAAVREFMPRHQWWPWLFSRTPQGFWQDIRNRRAYMAWLEKKLGIRRKDDWYRVSVRDFRNHGGLGLLRNYYGTVASAINEYKPRMQLQPWRFETVPQGFWSSQSNRARYLEWLGGQLDIRTPDMWYRVTTDDVRRHHGITLLGMYGDSMYRMLCDYLPQRDWKPWLFRSVPNGFWKSKKNRREYLCWLGDELGFRKPSDWYALTHDQIRRTGAQYLLSGYYRNSIMRVWKERYPKYRWDPKRRVQRTIHEWFLARSMPTTEQPTRSKSWRPE